jgi:hypothetical protein
MSGELPHTGGPTSPGGLLFLIAGLGAAVVSGLALTGSRLKQAATNRRSRA